MWNRRKRLTDSGMKAPVGPHMEASDLRDPAEMAGVDLTGVDLTGAN